MVVPFGSAADPFFVCAAVPLAVSLPSSLPPAVAVAMLLGTGTGGGILARRSTSACSSGNVVQVPERRSSSARARTRSGQPVDAREVVSVSESSGIALPTGENC
jgi:hypothetical protein